MSVAGRQREIPFNKAGLVGTELHNVEEAFRGMHVSGNGPFTRKCQQRLQDTLGVSRALLTTSCTDALEMAALLLDIQPGDEVIVPSFTFVSTINAFVLRGARPVFVDIRPDTLNIDENLVEPSITHRTKAICLVHYAGVACEMEKILPVAQRHGIAVVEDNAHGLFGRYLGRYLGTFGCLATQSFHETKNLTCGEGGALLINDAQYIERAEILWEKGTNRSRFFRGELDKYTWVDVGSSFLPSDILAAILYAQLEAGPMIQTKRRRLWNRYFEALRDWATETGVGLPIVPVQCEHPAHIFYLLLPTPDVRQKLIEHLNSHGIGTAFHYLPLHLSTMGQRFGGKPGDCAVTERVSGQLLRLPLYFDLTEDDQDWIFDALHSFRSPRPPASELPNSPVAGVGEVLQAV